MNPLILTFDPSGQARCLYSEAIDLTRIGRLTISRHSTIEFSDSRQRWEVRDPAGRLRFNNRSRAVCVAWEHQKFA